jgi:hypothetical protein
MRDSQIDGQIRERDAVRLLVDTAAMHAAGDESMTIEEAIRRGREVDGAVA